MSEVEIREYLDSVAASKVLGRSDRRAALLEYLVRTEADGDGDKLKGYAIGLDVFGKDEGFDPTSDSIVRVEIGRLRTALALFEASEHATTKLHVDIPVGTYRPTFSDRASLQEGLPAPRPGGTAGPTPEGSGNGALTPASRGRMPVLLLLAAAVLVIVGGFVALQGNNFQQRSEFSRFPILLDVNAFSGTALARDVTQIIKGGFSQSSIVKVLESEETREGVTRFVINGDVRAFNDNNIISVELTNIDLNRVTWVRRFQIPGDADLEGAVNQTIIGELQTRLLGSAKETLEGKELSELSAEELFLLATWVSGPAISSMAWETERVKLMNLALEKKADFGPAHSVLADKYSFLANVYEPWDTQENRDLAIFHAERAVELSPLDANAMFNVAQFHWHAGQMTESQRMFRRVTELDGGNSLARLFAVVVPFWCDDVPDDVMQFALEFDNQLSADDPIRWIVLTWIATLHTNRGEFALALEAATEASQIFQVGYTYMAHAMLLNKMGQIEDAVHAIKRQQRNWPGIGPKHYAELTVPRQCHQQDDSAIIQANYRELAESISGKLE